MTFSKSIVDINKKKQHRKPTLRQTAKKLKLEYARKRESCQPTSFRANQLSSQSPSPQESCQSDHVSSTSDSVVTGRRVAKETRSRNRKIKNFLISSPHVHLRKGTQKISAQSDVKRMSYVDFRLGRHVTPRCKRDPLEKPKNKKKLFQALTFILERAHKKFRLNPTSNEEVTSTSDSDVT